MSFPDIARTKGINYLLIATLPSSFFWISGTYFLLIKGLELIEYAKRNLLVEGFLGTTFLGDLIIGVFYAIPPLVTIGIIGNLIDKRPEILGKVVFYSLLSASICLLLFNIALKLLIAPITLFLITAFLTSLAALAVASHTLYGAITKWTHRGRTFAIGNLIFGLTVVLLLVISGSLEMDFYFSFLIISLIGIMQSLVFRYSTRNWIYWQNDQWPTKTWKILGRYSVRAYSFSHVMIYGMLGLTIGSLAQEGVTSEYTNFLGIELGAFETFWAVLILGTIIFALPAGYLSDRWGRKTLTILATYGIVLASLLASLHGLLDPNFDYLIYIITSFTIGISFALLHPTLDSSIWIDLASKDSIGRYCNINVLSLITGLVPGFAISYFFLNTLTEYRNIMVFLYIALAVIAVLPLFWVSDSFPPLEFFLLIVINEAGVPIFHYAFDREKELKIELPLISGALSAIASFMNEATGEKGAKLNLVRHGTHFILSDSNNEGEKLTAVIFANKNDPELSIILSKFLKRFLTKYAEELKDWNGDLGYFEDAVDDAEEIFGPLITISTTEPMIKVN